MNTFGSHFAFTSFGESHGRAIGGVIEGVPAKTEIYLDLITEMLGRRSGVGMKGVSPRAMSEMDEVEWLSGVVCQDGKLVALGTPIAFLIRNTDVRSQDYDILKTTFRPGHADYVYEKKYGIRDYRGGGRASARETAARVVAGGIAKQLLQKQGIEISARLVAVGEETDKNKFDDLLRAVQQSGDSIGGVVECEVKGMPLGVGEPIADKLSSHLAFAMLSINGCHGFEYGYGFDNLGLRGSDLYIDSEGRSRSPLDEEVMTGGIVGGMSDGTPLRFRCLFKPAATLTRIYKGRHDACIAVRAVSVVETMTALTIKDMITEY